MSSVEKEKVMKVRELMSSIVHTCRAQDGLDRAAGLLWEHDCGMLPVVDGEGRVGAVITDRDLCMAAFTRGRRLDEIPVAEAMSSSLVSCTADEDLTAAVRRMVEHQVHRLPVVDEQQRPCGVLSLNDLAGAAATDRRIVRPAMDVLIAVSHHRCEVPAPVEAAAVPQQEAHAKQ
ncbi:MAG: CBS domain-containing protein [Planctomycetes bacterium]|nr:CBS domain-containing protein [Planctomycetota bacterium]MCC7397219.1 CBS domain-containing protein [Planctomycetota bacterium]